MKKERLSICSVFMVLLTFVGCSNPVEPDVWIGITSGSEVVGSWVNEKTTDNVSEKDTYTISSSSSVYIVKISKSGDYSKADSSKWDEAVASKAALQLYGFTCTEDDTAKLFTATMELSSISESDLLQFLKTDDAMIKRDGTQIKMSPDGTTQIYTKQTGTTDSNVPAQSGTTIVSTSHDLAEWQSFTIDKSVFASCFDSDTVMLTIATTASSSVDNPTYYALQFYAPSSSDWEQWTLFKEGST